ncbi:hypothetical protein [Lewinella sp. W8]|uniref:hypothetical protein n=1 Tax=Lewinella sp. W8 TaxID=2528208 RepID=UPI0010676D16|nr:hypothetical protein [Lewinella sp. W8]MTB52937.1 hypothetical protein [Lewinella sp. W8]
MLITIVLAVPIAFFWLTGLDIVTDDPSFGEEEKIFVMELFLVAYAVSFLGIYLIRMVVAAVKTLALTPAEE